MPTYQYICNDCGESLEAVQKFSDDALTECPSCEGRLRKVYSAVGVVFKGSGFYRNDSRSGTSSSTPATPSKTDSTTPASTSSDSSSSSTPASSGASSTPPSTPTPSTPKKSGDSKVA